MITGSIVALVTPMSSDGSVDWAALERLLDLHMEAGTAAIGAVGTTGESATLTVPEHCQVIEHCVKYVAGRIPIAVRETRMPPSLHYTLIGPQTAAEIRWRP